MQYTIDEQGIHYRVEDDEADKQAAEAEANQPQREMTLREALVIIANEARKVEAIG